MTTKEFMEKLNQDIKDNNVAIVEKIQAVGNDPEAVYAIAKEAGVTDSFEVFKAEMEKMYEAMGQELNEDDLANVAGGVVEEVMIGVNVVAAVAACAAI